MNMIKRSEQLIDLYQKIDRNMQKTSIFNLFSEEEITKTNFNPQYQRNYIWNSTKAVKLIETVLINGEIPPLTMIKINNKIEIIDGRQRYETLLKF